MSYQPPPYPQQPPPYGPSQPTPYVPGAPQNQYGAPPPVPPRFSPPRRRRSRTPWIVVGSVLGLVLAFCLAGAIVSGGDPPDKVKVDVPAVTAKGADQKADDLARPKTYDLPVGSTMTVRGDDGSSRAGTLRSVKTFRKGCDDFSPAPENGRFVVVDVVVVQVKGTGRVNPLDFTFAAADGTSANGLSGAFSACDKPSLGSTNWLRAGQKRAGRIAFDTDSSVGTVEWAPGGLGAETAGSWKVG